MKIFKSIFFLLSAIIFGISLQSCSEDSPTSNNNNNNSSLVTSLSGFVNNITSTSRYMKAIVGDDSLSYISGTDSVSSDNIFNISLTIPPVSSLKNLNTLFPAGGGLSDTSAMGNFLNIRAFNNNAGLIDGSLVNSSVPPNNAYTTGDYLLFYIYCDRIVNVSGTQTNIFNSDTIVYNYSVTFETGYNKLKRTIINQRNNYTEFEIKNGGSENTNWYYQNLVDNNGFNSLGVKKQ